uniref:Fatty acyl-CoA reductase n=1 Tax=Lygus hesperus TaxID=30085 RepID=A0A0A9YAJ6_LYGHE
MQPTSVREFFANKSVLVTGGTGFMGKVLIEKLLRTCPEINTIYVICRSKRSKTPTTRILEMEYLPLFQPLLEKYPDALKKVKAIDGDLTRPRFGMMHSCKAELLENVELVFHLGASLRLEADLKDAVAANILGTKHALELAKGMTKLKAFVHVSTVFCQCDVRVVEEKIIKPNVRPETVIELTEWIKNNPLQREITDGLLDGHPNNYTFTKQLAETLVDDVKGTLPVCIVRPSIVTPTYREPIPGWVDSLNGPIGILVAGGKGVLRSMMCGRDNQAQVIPCDIAINAIILAACKTAFERNNEVTPVYNVSSGDFFPITYGTIFEKGMEAFFKYPCNPGLWYPDGSMTTNKFLHNTKVFLFQIIPALIIDLLLFICGQKPFLMRIQNRIKVGCVVLQYFTMRTWLVDTDHCTSLHDYKSKEEQEIYFLSNIDLDVDRMMKNCLLGTKQYCLREPLSTLRSARIKLWIYWAVDRSLKAYLLYHLSRLAFYLYDQFLNVDSTTSHSSLMSSSLPIR